MYIVMDWCELLSFHILIYWGGITRLRLVVRVSCIFDSICIANLSFRKGCAPQRRNWFLFQKRVPIRSLHSTEYNFKKQKIPHYRKRVKFQIESIV
jgi:hypothetical protein